MNYRPVSIALQVSAVLIGLGGFTAFELHGWPHLPVENRSISTLLFSTTSGPFLAWLICLPPLFFVRQTPGFLKFLKRPSACFCLCAVSGFMLPAWFGWNIRELPLLYHDEYAYLFQAQTYLAGRFYSPTPAFAAHFQQMHLMTEPVFVSRYFPGTAIWYMPFVHVGIPVAGSWALAGLIAGFVALTGHRFGVLCGYISGFVIAAAPFMMMLGNHILSPTPTMLGFAIFAWAYFRMFDAAPNRRNCFACLAGSAIGFAFLTRPVTAAGLGFAFAVYAVYRLRSNVIDQYRTTFVVLVVSFLVWCVALVAYNTAVLGTPFSTPYGVYTDKYTPSHVYGFYNQQRAAQMPTASVLSAYDSWSENLTPQRAIELNVSRWWNMARWTLGVIPLAILGVIILLHMPKCGDTLLLLMLSTVGLSLAYTPFAFPGLLGWSYFFEAAVPICLLLGAAFQTLWSTWSARNRGGVAIWWAGLLCISLLQNLTSSIPGMFTDGSEIIYPRRKAERQRELERAASANGSILVVFDAAPEHAVHSTIVHNTPTLNGMVVRAWQRGPQLEQLLAHYGDRIVYGCRYDENGNIVEWRRLRGAKN